VQSHARQSREIELSGDVMRKGAIENLQLLGGEFKIRSVVLPEE